MDDIVLSVMDLSKVTMYQACLMHSRAERVLKTAVSKQLEKWGITRMEWLLLATVAEDASVKYGHTMGELADALDVRMSQVTALVNKMIESKLITQEVAKHDRRTRYVQIASRGKKLLDDVEQDLRAAMRFWLADIPRDNLQVYMDTVHHLGRDRLQ